MVLFSMSRYLAHYVVGAVQRNRNLESVLSKILETYTAQTPRVEALAEQLGSLRSDVQRDVSFQLDSMTQMLVVRLEEVVRASLSTTAPASNTEWMMQRSMAQNLAFLRRALQ